MDRRSLVIGATCAFACVELPVPGRAQSADSRDGNWWRDLPKDDRATYVVGFFDGMELGNQFSYWGLDKSLSSSYRTATIKAYNKMVEQYLSDVTSGQLRDGLDDFYNDYRNRSIRIHGAVWLVLEGIAGTPKDELERRIENWRKNAHPPNE